MVLIYLFCHQHLRDIYSPSLQPLQISANQPIQISQGTRSIKTRQTRFFLVSGPSTYVTEQFQLQATTYLPLKQQKISRNCCRWYVKRKLEIQKKQATLLHSSRIVFALLEMKINQVNHLNLGHKSDIGGTRGRRKRSGFVENLFKLSLF